MRAKDWKRAIAASCLASVVGAGSAGTLTAQDRCLEPAGIPSGSHQTSSNGGPRPFSWDYHSSYYNGKAAAVVYRAMAAQQAEMRQQYLAAMEAQRAEEEATRQASGVVYRGRIPAKYRWTQGTPVVTSMPMSEGVVTSVEPMKTGEVVMVPTPAGSSIVAADSPVPAPTLVPTMIRKDGKLVTPGETTEVATSVPAGPEQVLSSKVVGEKVYRLNDDGSRTLISSKDFPTATVESVDSVVKTVPSAPVAAPAAPAPVQIFRQPATVVETEVPVTEKRKLKGGAVPMLPPVMIGDTASKPAANPVR